MGVCKKCGAEYRDGASSCPKCGASLSGGSAADRIKRAVDKDHRNEPKEKVLNDIGAKKAASPLPDDEPQRKKAASPLPTAEPQPIRHSESSKSDPEVKRAASPLPVDSEPKRAASPLPVDSERKRAASPLPPTGDVPPPVTPSHVAASPAPAGGSGGKKGCGGIIVLAIFIVIVVLIAKFAIGKKEPGDTTASGEKTEIADSARTAAPVTTEAVATTSPITERAEYSALAKESFADAGMIVAVKVSGTDNTEITFISKMINRTWVENFERSPMFVEIKELGFTRINYDDNVAYSIYRDIK